MIAFRTGWPRINVALTALLMVASVSLSPAATAQSNLPQHYYLCKKDLMVGGKYGTYMTSVNWSDQDFTTDKLAMAPEAYGKAFVRYLIDTFKPDNSTALETESFNWGQTCSTSWPYGRDGLEQTHKYVLSLGLAVEVDWAYSPDQASRAAAAPKQAPATASSESVAYDCDGGPDAGGFRFVATYYYSPDRQTPVRAAVTLGGKTTELAGDGSDASGLSFGAKEIGISRFQGGAHLYRGSKASNCVAR